MTQPSGARARGGARLREGLLHRGLADAFCEHLASQEEYANVATLEQRLQTVARKMVNPAPRPSAVSAWDASGSGVEGARRGPGLPVGLQALHPGGLAAPAETAAAYAAARGEALEGRPTGVKLEGSGGGGGGGAPAVPGFPYGTQQLAAAPVQHPHFGLLRGDAGTLDRSFSAPPGGVGVPGGPSAAGRAFLLLQGSRLPGDYDATVRRARARLPRLSPAPLCAAARGGGRRWGWLGRAVGPSFEM